jgi:flagellar basal-body rod protein FlgF
MDNTLMIGLQAQRVLQRRLDIAANNLANASTVGFKADALVSEEYSKRPARAQAKPHDVRFVRDVGMARVMDQGSIARTGNPMDVAIEGDGFFMVQGPTGVAYTRDGQFKLGPAGQLLSSEGMPVLNQGGQPIVFDPQGETPAIAADGAIRVGEAVVGQLGLATFAEPGALEKLGDNLYRASAEQPPQPFAGEVVQGAVENSNVRPVLELTRLMEISRAYENAARIVRQGDELRQRAVDRLGRA